MTALSVRSILAGLVMPLFGFSCMAFREFQVRPHLSDPSRPVTVATLAEDYTKVAGAVKTWADQQGLKQMPCHYYSTPTAMKPAAVQGLSPGCQVFEGDGANAYRVRTEFTPSNNSTRVSVLSSTHNAADSAVRRLKEHLESGLGAATISDYGGGEMPNRRVEPTR